jgi:DNA invertase Pin-like site-specific DNA recombinase
MSELRFADLIRVSTERQEQQGESLKTQRAQLDRDVTLLGGTIVARFGGQEHATEGWERKELIRLTQDAQRGLYDAVIVADASRWDRGSPEARHALEVFKENKIRFFISTTEYNLYKDEDILFLEMASAMNKFFARNQTRKSMLNKIARARRGHPTCGQPPWGRTFNKDKETWEVLPDKQALIADVAQRYLDGEALPDLAKYAGMSLSTLWKILMHRSGTEWVQEFKSDRLNICETVVTQVPELLSATTIKAMKTRAQGRRTCDRKQLKNRYLLARLVYCAGCGGTLSGRTDYVSGVPMYDHMLVKHRRVPCPCRVSTVHALPLERAVLHELFNLFGNPRRVKEAVEQATPNRSQIDTFRHRLSLVAKELEDLGTSRDRIVRAIARGSLTDDQADRQLNEMREREAVLQTELARLNSELANAPTAAEVKEAAEQVSRAFNQGKLWAMKMSINTNFDDMTWEEKHFLLRTVFSGTAPDGRRHGIYVSPAEGKRGHRQWAFRMLGRLVNWEGYTPVGDDIPYPGSTQEWSGGRWQRELLRDAANDPQSRSRPSSHRESGRGTADRP